MTDYNGMMNNSRGKIVSASNPTFVKIQGWGAGVEAERVQSASVDTFRVFMLPHGAMAGERILLGTVTETPEGTKWTPAHIPEEYRGRLLTPTE